MLFQLVKKDFLIVKKYVLIMFAVCILFPVFLLWRSPEYAGILGFVLITIFSIFMLLQYVSLKETQYPKASTLLCALPFSRKNIVLSKYIFCILIYLACCLIFGIETLIFPQLRSIGYKVPILLFMVVSLFLGVYLPAQYKLGYEKTKLFFVVLIMASPFIFAQSLKIENSFITNILDNINPVFLVTCSMIASFLILIVSSTILLFLLNNIATFFKNRSHSKETQGTIISFRTINPSTEKMRNSKWATVSYNVAGKNYISQNQIQVSMTADVGSVVQIRYDIFQPEKLYHFSVKRIIVSSLVVVGCLLIITFKIMH